MSKLHGYFDIRKVPLDISVGKAFYEIDTETGEIKFYHYSRAQNEHELVNHPATPEQAEKIADLFRYLDEEKTQDEKSSEIFDSIKKSKKNVEAIAGLF